MRAIEPNATTLRYPVKLGLGLWWAKTWRSFLIGLACNLIINLVYITSYAVAHGGIDPAQVSKLIPWSVQALEFLLGFYIGYVMVGIVFQRRYAKFAVEVRDASGAPIAWNDAQQLRLWWALTWREWVFGILAGLAGGVVGGIAFALLKAIGVSKWLLVLLAIVGIFWLVLYTVGRIYAHVLKKDFQDFRLAVIFEEPQA